MVHEYVILTLLDKQKTTLRIKILRQENMNEVCGVICQTMKYEIVSTLKNKRRYKGLYSATIEKPNRGFCVNELAKNLLNYF